MLKALRLLFCCLPLSEEIQLRGRRDSSSIISTELSYHGGNETHSSVRSLYVNHNISDDHVITGEVLHDNTKVRDKLSYSPEKLAQISTDRYAESVVTSVSCSSSADSPPIKIKGGRYNVTFANKGILCTLSKFKDEKIVGIARSYDGNPWEIAAGGFAESLFNGIFSCDSTRCHVHLSQLEIGAYYLTTYIHSVSSRDDLARFLETATFGITQSDILEIETLSPNTSEEKIQAWIGNQMNLPYTSHRVFWREGLNPKVSLTKKLHSEILPR